MEYIGAHILRNISCFVRMWAVGRCTVELCIYTVRKVLVDFAVYVTKDAIAKLLGDVKFSQMEGNVVT